MTEVSAREAAAREATLAAETAAAGARASAKEHAAREASLHEGEAALVRAQEELSLREAALKQREDALRAREESVSLQATALEARESAAAAAEASLQQRQQHLAEAAAAAAAPLGMPFSAADGSKELDSSAPPSVGPQAQPVDCKPKEAQPQPLQQPPHSQQLPPTGETEEPAAEASAEASVGSSKAGVAEVKQELHRSKVRFEEMRQQLLQATSSAPKLQGATSGGSARPAPKPLPKPAAAKSTATEAEPKQLQCDRTAEWARSENLTLSLLRQKADPDEVFYPLPHQRTCELTEIFSAPRPRVRAKGSGEWTPSSDAKAAQAEEARPQESGAAAAFQLVGVEGEYNGEVLPVPLSLSADGGTAVLGRSSSCDVTLGRDDQISRKHLQIDVCDGKLMVRDLGST